MDECLLKLWSYYDNLHEVDKDLIDQELEINGFANPTVGEGFVISSSEDFDREGMAGWNFHWGGVIMESNDERDKVVLDNFAVVGDEPKENTAWKLAIYDTNHPNQNFHEQFKASNKHGTTPTTMRIRKKPESTITK